jgi:hypothetical protein
MKELTRFGGRVGSLFFLLAFGLSFSRPGGVSMSILFLSLGVLSLHSDSVVKQQGLEEKLRLLEKQTEAVRPSAS